MLECLGNLAETITDMLFSLIEMQENSISFYIFLIS